MATNERNERNRALVLYARGGLFSKIRYFMALSNTILVILGFICILLSYIFVVMSNNSDATRVKGPDYITNDSCREP